MGIADYFDQGGKRHLKTFATKKTATGWLVTTRHRSNRECIPPSTSITVAEAAALWIRRGELEKLERSTLNKSRNPGGFNLLTGFPRPLSHCCHIHLRSPGNYVAHNPLVNGCRQKM